MHITKGPTKEVNVTINGSTLEQTKSATILGRVINSSLTAKAHYQKVIESSSNNLKLFKYITNIKSGLHPQKALNIYKAMVRSKIEYCSTTLANSANASFHSIQVLQNKILRRCLGLTPSTPIPLIYALANELLPNERTLWLVAKEVVKLIAFNNPIADTIKSNSHLNTSYAIAYNTFSNVMDDIDAVHPNLPISNLVIFEKTTNTKKSNMTKEEIIVQHSSMLAEYRSTSFKVIYTDSSVGEEKTGCGIYLLNTDTEHSFHISFKSSSAFGELLAIEEAIDIAIRNNYSSVVIFTDSQIACQTLKRHTSTNSIAAKIFNKISNHNFNNVHVRWIPSHKNIFGNEKADALAKSAIINSSCKTVKLTIDEACKRIKNYIYDQSFQNFLNYSNTNQNLYATIFPSRRNFAWFKNFKFNPKDIKTLNRILTGHTYDKKYLVKIKATNSSLCRCGDTDCYVHQTFQCPLLNNIRVTFNVFNEAHNFKEVFKDKNNAKITQLVKFFQKADLKF
ncbi:uncharacterized protein [Eurosta solidaginis]|uniref:uncharacterized protein isoform X1 n=1 Tax=Eurosta solidaginis TaxID=178769 RepID=UPI003530AE15